MTMRGSLDFCSGVRKAGIQAFNEKNKEAPILPQCGSIFSEEGEITFNKASARKVWGVKVYRKPVTHRTLLYDLGAGA